ncbi:N-acetylated-alpha-linked acidic dipeptidase 2-like [Amphiura filiformis]|uniref:N-acetylated-alpha-linked acidic dipeptidase 2-like n=1 Tax=Amphiura filiformis TaxID=82378 RepID=UPI003B2171FB
MAPDIQLHHGVHQIKMVPQSVRKHRFIVKRVAIIILLGLGIGIGIGIGFAASNPPIDDDDVANETDIIGYQATQYQYRDDISDLIQRQISARNIRNNLRRLTNEPHVAGTPADLEGAKSLRDTWVLQGLDTVNIKAYKVLLSYPSTEKGKENKVQIVNPQSGTVHFTSAIGEDTFGERELEQKGILPPYNAYSAAGDVQGDMVYVNYGSLSDLQYLTTFMSPPINLTGKIFIARHGAISRSRKVLNAEQYGAAALVLYMDPAEHHIKGRAPDKAYPGGPWLPPTAAQRGSIHPDAGDPLTPHYPATEHAFRLDENQTRLPRILVHPLSYSDASFILGKGRVVVYSKKELRWTYNVIGFIRGDVEPDRYVLVGNHRDAWGLGAVDPTSGTASLIEITRVFGKLKMGGWRPRRTLVFCSWGAEEFGLIGSVEWTEEYYHILSQRAVAYLNLDIAVAGNHVLSAGASPHLIPVIYEATQKVPDPQPEGHRRTIYDTMKERRRDSIYPEPWIPPLRQSGSDFYGFLQGVGVPCINVYYDTEGEDKLYSLYHTAYETFRLVEEYIDPDFRYHQAIARVVAEMLFSLGDKQLLPFDLTRYTKDIVMIHVVLSPQSSPHNRNYPRTFPGLVDVMVSALNKPTSDEAWRNVAKHVSVLTYVIQSATDTLKDVTSWL